MLLDAGHDQKTVAQLAKVNIRTVQRQINGTKEGKKSLKREVGVQILLKGGH